MTGARPVPRSPLQLCLFDQQDLAEISSRDFPGERLIACRHPLLAAERARKSSPGPGCVTTGDEEGRRAESMPYSMIFPTGTRHRRSKGTLATAVSFGF